ncbi:AMP-binding protein [Sodalis ligni]|nr:AMP-binding protein [Sodalis ligni]
MDAKEFRLTHNDRIISRAPLKFDLSVFDIFNTLSVGATLICYDWNKRRDISIKHRDYVALLENENATMLYTTPSTLLTLMEKGQFLKNKTIYIPSCMPASPSRWLSLKS